MDIVGPDAGNRIRLIPVHVNEALKTVFLTRIKHPVDRPLLVDLQMVRIEVIHEVAADDILGLALAAQGISDILQILFQSLIAENYTDKLHKTANDLILKVLVIANGYDVILVGREEGVPLCIPFSAGVGQSSPS